VPNELAELLDRARARNADHRDELLLHDIGAQISVVIVRCRDQLTVANAIDAAPTEDAAGLLGFVGRREQLGDVDAESFAQLIELVVGQRNAVVLHLRQRRDGEAGGLAHVR
jgi:hypothetical protein